MASAAPMDSSLRQWRLVAVLVAVIGGSLGLAYYWFAQRDYAVLASGVRPEQAAAIVDELKKENVAYALKDGGTTILVPARDVDAARLDVSGGELPLKGTVGFELFNQSDMGLTDFAQKVNYQRALQGEIARTIMAMEGIAYARVHIALPERSLFRAARSEPRAAVTLTPLAGVGIDAERIAGIQRLVAATVPDLAIDQVAILNERGQLLTPEFSDTPAASASETALETNYRERVERAVAAAAPRAHVETRVIVVPRGQGRVASAAPASAGEARDYSVRIVLFERTGLGRHDEQAVRRAVTAEIGLDPAGGDQLSFSPAPEIAGRLEAQAPVAAAPPPADLPRAAQEQFMASLGRAWAAALSLLGALALMVFALSFRHRRLGRREALVRNIRQHLLPPEDSADVT
jgi:flagellar M-ring protein FliF